jgi:hypothetical protein
VNLSAFLIIYFLSQNTKYGKYEIDWMQKKSTRAQFYQNVIMFAIYIVPNSLHSEVDSAEAKQSCKTIINQIVKQSILHSILSQNRPHMQKRIWYFTDENSHHHEISRNSTIKRYDHPYQTYRVVYYHCYINQAVLPESNEII